jgi:hypothetical protein
MCVIARVIIFFEITSHIIAGAEKSRDIFATASLSEFTLLLISYNP